MAKKTDRILVGARWKILQNYTVFLSAEFFLIGHRIVIALLKLHVKPRRISKYNNTVFHLEKLKDLACAHKYPMTVSNQPSVVSAFGDPL